MLRNTLAAGLSACLALAVPARPAAGDEKKPDPAPAGTWIKKGMDAKLEFSDKEVLKVFPHGATDAFAIVCSYTLGKDGMVKVKVKDYEGPDGIKEKVKTVVPVGLEFSFTWKAKDGSATLADVMGEKADAFRTHLEGDYEVKK